MVNGGLILRKLDKYIPAEDTALAAFFYWVFRIYLLPSMILGSLGPFWHFS